MTKVGEVNLKDAKGNQYPFNIYRLGTSFKNLPGIYAFIKDKGTTWGIVYIGQTNSFETRLTNHPKLPCVEKNGGTHIAVHTEANQHNRDAIEKALISHYKPPCNELLK